MKTEDLKNGMLEALNDLMHNRRIIVYKPGHRMKTSDAEAYVSKSLEVWNDWANDNITRWSLVQNPDRDEEEIIDSCCGYIGMDPDKLFEEVVQELYGLDVATYEKMARIVDESGVF